jgi:hypothetical protein
MAEKKRKRRNLANIKKSYVINIQLLIKKYIII